MRKSEAPITQTEVHCNRPQLKLESTNPIPDPTNPGTDGTEKTQQRIRNEARAKPQWPTEPLQPAGEARFNAW